MWMTGGGGGSLYKIYIIRLDFLFLRESVIPGKITKKHQIQMSRNYFCPLRTKRKPKARAFISV